MKVKKKKNKGVLKKYIKWLNVKVMGGEREWVMMERESESDRRRESESDIFGREKIIWGEIWAVGSTQIDFNRR